MVNKENLSELHQLLLKLLVAFKYVCEKGDLWYSLGYGSVLGAVRHHGFIPWDTDADVLIMLPDKEKFREAFTRFKPEGIALKCHDKEKRCLQSHDSLYFEDSSIDSEIHLDIYPLVGAPSDVVLQQKFVSKSCYQDRIIRSKYVDIRKCKKKNRILVAGAKMIDYLIPDRILRKNIYNREHEYCFEESEYLVTLTNYGKASNCIPKEIMYDTISAQFEGIDFKIPKNWDYYLTRIYGSDYMTPKKY